MTRLTAWTTVVLATLCVVIGLWWIHPGALLAAIGGGTLHQIFRSRPQDIPIYYRDDQDPPSIAVRGGNWN